MSATTHHLAALAGERVNLLGIIERVASSAKHGPDCRQALYDGRECGADCDYTTMAAMSNRLDAIDEEMKAALEVTRVVRTTLPAPRKGPWMQTFTGRAFYLGDPRAEDVCIEDIAHALACINRYTGHACSPYSVAQHSVIVSEIVCELGHREAALAALMHDAAEAYYGDMSSPLKWALDAITSETERPHYRVLYDRGERVVLEAFGLPPVLPPIVKRADMIALADERERLLGPSPYDWACQESPTGRGIVPWSWEESKRRFLERFYLLRGSK